MKLFYKQFKDAPNDTLKFLYILYKVKEFDAKMEGKKALASSIVEKVALHSNTERDRI